MAHMVFGGAAALPDYLSVFCRDPLKSKVQNVSIAQGRKDQRKVQSLTPTGLFLDRRCIGLATAVRWENSLMAIDPCGCQAQLLEKDRQEKLAEAALASSRHGPSPSISTKGSLQRLQIDCRRLEIPL
jgi:hypothetical protein